MALIPLPKKGKEAENPNKNKDGLLDRLLDGIADIDIKYQKFTLPLIGA